MLRDPDTGEYFLNKQWHDEQCPASRGEPCTCDDPETPEDIETDEDSESS